MGTRKKKQTNINFIIPLVIYPFEVVVSIAQDNEQLGKVLDTMSNLTEEDIRACGYPSEYTKGRAVMFSTNASIIRLKELPQTPADFGTLAHEIFHIVTFIMDRVGMKLAIEVSDEAYSYLIGYLTEQIYKATNKYY